MRTANKPTRGPGRPALPPGEPQRQVSVLLPVSVVEQARRIGEGNLTEGIRKAVREYRA